MDCPKCVSVTLDERDRDGVTVDACPQCRGLWLDRGELERLISRASHELDELEQRHPGRRDDDDDDDHRPRQGGRRKRRWFESLGDIFD